MVSFAAPLHNFNTLLIIFIALYVLSAVRKVQQMCIEYSLHQYYPFYQTTITDYKSTILQNTHENTDNDGADIQATELSYQLDIHVFAWRRAKSLQRLLNSLHAAVYTHSQRHVVIPIHFHIDGNPLERVRKIVAEFEWPYGMKSISDSGNQNRGLRDSITEDDLELSPLYFHYIDQCIRRRLIRTDEDRLAGCSLYTPRVDEITDESPVEQPSRWISNRIIGSDHRLFRFQLPCSWGAVWRLDMWQRFLHNWYQPRRRLDTLVGESGNLRKFLGPLKSPNSCTISGVGDQIQPFPPIAGLRSHRWSHSWKRYMIEYFYVNGWFMLYPSLADQRAFSTNHYEEGVHSINPDLLLASDHHHINHQVYVPDSLRSEKGWQDGRFTTPLISKKDRDSPELHLMFEKDMPLKNLPLINCHHRLVEDNNASTLIRTGQDFLRNFCGRNPEELPFYLVELCAN